MRGKKAGQPPAPEPPEPQADPGARGDRQQVAIAVGIGVVVVLVVAIVVVIVTDDGSEGSPGVNLHTALLTQQDIEGGYVPHVLAEADEIEYEAGPECDPLLEVSGAGGAEWDATAAFVSDPDRFISHALHWTAPDDIPVADFAAAVADCPEYRETAMGRTTTVIQQRLPSDSLGDASVAYVQNRHSRAAGGEEYTLLRVRVLWERDGVQSSLIYLDAGTELRPGDLLVAGEVETFVRELAATADRRLERVLDR